MVAASEPVSLECGLDLSALGLPEPGSEKVWAVSESEDLTVRLLDLSEAKDGSLQGIFHFISRSRDDRAIRFYLDEEDPLGDALVNGCYLRDVLHAAESTLRLSAGYDLYVPFSLSRIMQLDPVGSSLGRVNNPFSSGDGFAYWAIDSLRRLTLPVLIDGTLRLFDFSPAFPLPLTASPASSPADAAPAVPLLRDGPLSLNLRSVRAAEPGAIRLMADIRNDSGETLAFRLSGGLPLLFRNGAASAPAAERLDHGHPGRGSPPDPHRSDPGKPAFPRGALRRHPAGRNRAGSRFRPL